MVQELVRTTPEAVGIPFAAVSAFVDAVQRSAVTSAVGSLHSLMLLRHGQVASEAWWPPYAPERPHMLFSLSKAFTSTAVGLAVHEGLLSVDQPVLSFFPDVAPARVSRNLAAMTVHHLLSMNTGHHTDASAATFLRADPLWTKRFLRVPVTHKPGTWFVYNTAATYMLSAIVQRLAGMPMVEYLQPRLFDPLGIAPPAWESCPAGINTGGYGLSLKTEDIARFGQMLLQKGRWGNDQIVPEAWIELATSYHSDNSNQGGNPEWIQGYGYQFWLCRHGAYRGDGAFGQYCLVMPAQDAVLAITSGIGDMQVPLDAVWEHLMPAMGATHLPEDAAGHAALAAQLADLRIAPQTGAPDAPVAPAISGKRYTMGANPAGIKAITLTLDPAGGGTLRVRDRASTHRIAISAGAWLEGTTTLDVQTRRGPRLRKERPVAASGAWTDDSTYAVQLAFVETPFIVTLTLHYAGEGALQARFSSNVGFGPTAMEMAGVAG